MAKGKAYVLMSQMYEEVRIYGVFTNREDAQRELETIGHISEDILKYYHHERWVDDEEMWLEIVETEIK